MDENPRTGFFSRIFRKKEDNEIENEIVSMLTEGQEQGEILESEAEMITNIFDLDETSASEIMTHRKNISAIDGEQTLNEIMPQIVEESFSRFPVFLDNIDNIIGILHIKDCIRCYMNEAEHAKKLKDIPSLMQKPKFIPETSKINSIFKNMQAEKTHMEIVVDEYGQTAGIICMEDILEEIVGNIFDEHDEVEYNIVKLSEKVYQVKGLTPLEEITDVIGIPYEEEDYDTLNGYLISRLDRIPEDDEGTEITENGVSYRILSVEDKMIALVRIDLQNASFESAEPPL